MRILFACGGTGGHINPALAIADTIKKDNGNVEILFAGNPNGMEANLVPKAGYAFVPIIVYGFQRRLNPENIKRNIKAAVCLATSGHVAKKIVKDFLPDVVVGTGGYVSGPVLRAAAKLGVRTVTHESNAYPGVTTKLLARYVDKVLLTAAEAKKYLPEGKNYIVTGTPVRREILSANREEARKKLGVGERVCLLSFGGSLGATPINEAVADVIAHFKGKGTLHQIHATGSYDHEAFPEMLEKRNVKVEGDPHLDIREYIYDMPECIAAADIVLCRSGAATLAELQCAGRASILVPSPYLAENHQYHNAMTLASRNAAIVIEEKDLTGDRLCGILEELAADRGEIANLGRNAASMAIADANKRICNEIYGLMRRPSGGR